MNWLTANDMDNSMSSLVIFFLHREAHITLGTEFVDLNDAPVLPGDIGDEDNDGLGAATTRVAEPTAANRAPRKAEAPAKAATVKAGDASKADAEPVELDDETVALQAAERQTRAESWFSHLLDLCAAFQTKTLKTPNLKSYFAQHGMNGIDNNAVLKVILFISSKIEVIMATPELRAALLDSDWEKYHTTYSSTAKLLETFIESFPEAMLVALGITRDMIDDIAASSGDMWSKVLNAKLNSRLIAMAHIFLSECQYNFGEWWQGNSAVRKLSPMLATKYRAIFKQYIKISTSMNGLAAADTVSKLVAIIEMGGDFVADEDERSDASAP